MGRYAIMGTFYDFTKLDLIHMEEMHIDGLEGKVCLVIWIMPIGKHELFFSTKTSILVRKCCAHTAQDFNFQSRVCVTPLVSI